ncbi:PREDICTED: probable ATP-dependent RNA helicase DDX49 [Nicrophorus vespilloides]|uniref:RNA helicase n=1 Tax=Nicrophorus vespilloides TaxID=110193 RepID=A0ABM1NAP3_NICVS|nr:PREDICTED: probable ATP-dependent RNA helicase DDX49 [Nicrophorus vespilloides]
MSDVTFAKMKLSSWLIKQCASIGVKSPTLIQQNCIPQIMQGKDCIGAAKTGSGKTLAFALPILQKLCEDPYGIFALILTPTRELAFQIADQFAVFGKPMNLRHSVIVGGMDMVTQGQELAKKPHIVVATPGRLADHLDSCNTFSLKKIQFLVLDEADRLLGGNYDEHIQTIFQQLPKKKQSLFFSATITDTLEKLKGVTGNDVFLYEAPNDIATVEQLDQHYVLCPKDVRDGYLVQTIRAYREENEEGNVMIFTDSCRSCQVISMMLNEVGFENVALHGMIPQSQRLSSLAKFKSNTIKMLIATDVASRGLDIPTVQLVVNHFVPKIPKEYVHRVGRTARAGRGGKAITLVSPHEILLLQAIEEFIHMKLTEYTIDDTEVGKIYTQVAVTKSEASIKVDEKEFYEKKRVNQRKQWILEGLDPDEEEDKVEQEKKKRKRTKRLKNKSKKLKIDTENDVEDGKADGENTKGDQKQTSNEEDPRFKDFANKKSNIKIDKVKIKSKKTVDPRFKLNLSKKDNKIKK